MSTSHNAALLSDTMQQILLEAQQYSQKFHIEELEQWLEHELHGYGDFAHFPDYRIVECKQLGIFVKPDQQLQHFEEIHDDCLNERDRCVLRYLHIHQPLHECLSNDEEIQQAWPMRILASYANDIIPGYNCVRAWQSYHAPLNERFIQGVLGHLLHLLELNQQSEIHDLLNKISQLCQAEYHLHKIWHRLYSDSPLEA